MYESNKDKMRFRQLPWAHWIMALVALSGFVTLVMSLENHVLKLESKLQAFLLVFLFAFFLLFLVSGKVKSTVIDKKAK